jgi:hypothetical protein
LARPTPQELLDAAEELTRTAQQAEDLRRELRWETAIGEAEREARIEAMLDDLADAMGIVRSAIGRFAGGWAKAPEGVEDALRTASGYAQYQRKQLKKMRA